MKKKIRRQKVKEQLPEDGHNRWPKHVGCYAVYNRSVYALVGRISHNESSVHGHESFKSGVWCLFQFLYGYRQIQGISFTVRFNGGMKATELSYSLMGFRAIM